jgi:tRNA U34 5-methylaminomethyl-2-thiouridine-forming methyltransferase MnmC
MKNGANQPSPTLQQTPDGSYTFYDSHYHSHLHSINGALTESQYVYIENGLSYIHKDTICIFEMGFGTGLNAFLAYQYAEKHHKSIYYQAIDINPIPSALLPTPDFLSDNCTAEYAWKTIVSSEWNKETTIADFFTINKQIHTIQDYAISGNMDVVFFDAFAPSVQPEVWSAAIFRSLYDALNPGGIIVTYSAARLAKTAMSSAGFILEKLIGPTGKRHMLRAKKLQQINLLDQ